MKDKISKKKALIEMIDVITLSISREFDSRALYLNAAKKSISDESKNLFLSLAKQEHGHEKMLRNILGVLKEELKILNMQT